MSLMYKSFTNHIFSVWHGYVFCVLSYEFPDHFVFKSSAHIAALDKGIVHTENNILLSFTTTFVRLSFFWGTQSGYF